MARGVLSNYASASAGQPTVATAGSDPYKATDTQLLAQAFNEHQHQSGIGLGVIRLQTSATPSAAGQVQVTGNTLVWWGATASATRSAVDVESSQTVTGAKTFSAAVTVSAGGLTVTGGLTVSTGGITVSASGITVTGNSIVTGTLSGITTLTATTLAGTLSTAAQPNVTSVGTLTGLTVSGTTIAEFDVASGSGTPLTLKNLGGANPANNINFPFTLLSSTGAERTYGSITVTSTTNANTAEGGTMALRTIQSGSLTTVLTLSTTGTATFSAAVTVSAGGLTVSASGITVTGNSTITGTLGGLTGLTVASGGATITAGGLTVSASGATLRSDANSAAANVVTVQQLGTANVANAAQVIFNLRDFNGAERSYGLISVTSSTLTAGAFQGTLAFKTAQVGTLATVMSMTAGVVIGNPGTTADLGGGKLNVEVGVYLAGTAYTNPGYVFERHYAGVVTKFADQPGATDYRGAPTLADVRRITRETFDLPGMADDHDLFRRAAFTLEKLEEAYLHIFALEDRILALETRGSS